MSGHSKWSTIKRKKEALDQKRGKIFTKLIKEITVAAKVAGGEVDSNPRLRLAVDNAKSANMPADNINRAIKKAAGELEGVTFLELMYEGYGPSGVAFIAECLTDNKNRTVAEVRHLFTKYGNGLGETGSVDLQTEVDFFEVTTSVDSFETVRKTLVDVGLEIENAALQWIAKNTIEVGGDDAEKVAKLYDMLEDCDDVQSVYSNADFKE